MAELKQFVGFMIAEEHFGVDIMIVEEIIKMIDITPVPRAPSFVEGIINMRGRVIPIVDLRKKLGMSSGPVTDQMRIIVIFINEKRIGFIVDNVEEVIRINEDAIDVAPGTKHTFDNYVAGVARTEKGMIIMLDIMNIFSDQEQKLLVEITR